MPVNSFYHQCRRGIGRPVRIRMRDGRTHVGIIERVTPSRVFIRNIGGRPRNYGGFGYGGYAYPWGFGSGFVFGFAIGAIVSLAFIPFW